MAKREKEVNSVGGGKAEIINEPNDKKLSLGMDGIESENAIEVPDGVVVKNPNRGRDKHNDMDER